MASLKIQGDAYEEMANELLERAKEGKMNEDEFKVFVVASLTALGKSKAGTERVLGATVSALNEYPPILWLLRKRPRSSIPFLVGLSALLSSVFISDIRAYLLDMAGLPGGQLPEGSAGIALALAIGGFVTWVVASSTEKSFEDYLEEE